MAILGSVWDKDVAPNQNTNGKKSHYYHLPIFVHDVIWFFHGDVPALLPTFQMNAFVVISGMTILKSLVMGTLSLSVHIYCTLMLGFLE